MPVALILFVLLFATAVIVARLKDLFAAAMLTGLFSLVSAGLFMWMDAVDVAFTEAAVGAGISTILMLGTLSLTARNENQQAFRWLPLVVVLVTGSVLIVGTLDMPAFGDPQAPAHQHEMYAGFITIAEEEVEHIPNIVTVILASVRSHDTLGETTVILTAAVGVFLLLGSRRRHAAAAPPEAEDSAEPRP